MWGMVRVCATAAAAAVVVMYRLLLNTMVQVYGASAAVVVYSYIFGVFAVPVRS